MKLPRANLLYLYVLPMGLSWASIKFTADVFSKLLQAVPGLGTDGTKYSSGVKMQTHPLPHLVPTLGSGIWHCAQHQKRERQQPRLGPLTPVT